MKPDEGKSRTRKWLCQEVGRRQVLSIFMEISLNNFLLFDHTENVLLVIETLDSSHYVITF